MERLKGLFVILCIAVLALLGYELVIHVDSGSPVQKSEELIDVDAAEELIDMDAAKKEMDALAKDMAEMQAIHDMVGSCNP